MVLENLTLLEGNASTWRPDSWNDGESTLNTSQQTHDEGNISSSTFSVLVTAPTDNRRNVTGRLSRFFIYSPIFILNMVAFVLHLFVLILLHQSRKLKLSFSLILLTQVYLDIAFSLVAVAGLFGVLFKPTHFPDNIMCESLCKLWYSKFIFMFFRNASIFNSTLLTIEMYLKVVHPIWHKVTMTRNKLIMMILGAVIFVLIDSILVYIVPAFFPHQLCTCH